MKHRKNVGHYCNCHKTRQPDDMCICGICRKILGIYGELYRVKYLKTNKQKDFLMKGDE